MIWYDLVWFIWRETTRPISRSSAQWPSVDNRLLPVVSGRVRTSEHHEHHWNEQRNCLEIVDVFLDISGIYLVYIYIIIYIYIYVCMYIYIYIIIYIYHYIYISWSTKSCVYIWIENQDIEIHHSALLCLCLHLPDLIIRVIPFCNGLSPLGKLWPCKAAMPGMTGKGFSILLLWEWWVGMLDHRYHNQSQFF